MKWVLFGVSIGAIVLIAKTALAAWMFQSSESAFDDGNTAIAATVGDVGGIGLKCQAKELSVIYMVEGTDLTQEAVNTGNPLHMFKLKLRIDKGEILTLDAFAQVPKSGTLILAAPLEGSQAASIRDAKNKIAIAFSMGEQNFYEQSVAAAGSSSAIRKVMSQCGV
ncbi:hypothetical protein Rhsp01_62570 [Rhizobium sp. NBRC 114257]|uniref:Cation transporter n=1 Tax=Rhizobium dioscoreae TaxID=2653122 RepID=A0ABQ0ZE42_9HYPH|nr:MULTISPECIES: hypothetical protein [Rhizobium]GES53616.1 hypothetical protein RsS93_62300 [Rhizobium dioscoreae]GLU85081.1 hypothetical protein Rhsp01_62570 [Rhizobium sp. NBRC 114257]